MKRWILFPALGCLSLGLQACAEIEPVESGLDGEFSGVRIASITPDSDLVAGGAYVTLTGSGLAGDGTQILLGDEPALDIEAVGDDLLTFRVPPAPDAGLRDLRVLNSNGHGVVRDGFLYGLPLQISSVEPSRAALSGGTTVTVTGQGFVDRRQTTNVFVGAEVVQASVEENTITFTAPPRSNLTFESIRIENRFGSVEQERVLAYVEGGLLAASARRQGGGVYFIDPETGASTQLSSTTEFVSALHASPDGTTFAGYRDATGVAHFGRLDIGTGRLTSISNSVGVSIPDFAVAGDLLLSVIRRQGVQIAESMLIDPRTGESFSGPHRASAGVNFSGRAVATDDSGKTWFAGTRSDGTLHSLVDTDFVAETQLDGSTSDRIYAMAFYNGTLFAIRGGQLSVVPPGGSKAGGVFLEIDRETGVMTEIGSVPDFVDALSALPPVESL